MTSVDLLGKFRVSVVSTPLLLSRVSLCESDERALSSAPEG